ncbi:hypothetical protein V5O48_008997 [Marasmius crinis-equi]|uniref:Uncharacterized protein n=1 Tax=Marasmius crinis-equi TaxID=585013 RepID=A0ABR3FD07_9AGAR
MPNQRLQELYGSRFASWATGTDEQRFELLSQFRDTVTRSSLRDFVTYFDSDQTGLARLVTSGTTVEALSDWIEEGCSALELIQGNLTPCEDGRERKHGQHSSSPDNVTYARDPITLRLEPAQTHAAILRAMQIVRAFDLKHHPWCRRPSPLPNHFMNSEADVNTYNVVEVLQPTIAVLNSILESVGAPHRLSLRSQGRAQIGSGTVDYSIYCNGSVGPAGRVEAKDDKEGFALCLLEDKWWMSCGPLERWCRKTQPVLTHDTGHKDVEKILGQLRKTPYTIVSDGVRYIGLVWGQCEGWELGRSHRFAPEYSFPHHIAGKEHQVRTVIGYNAVGPSGEPTARMVVTTLCVMALQDIGALKRR